MSTLSLNESKLLLNALEQLFQFDDAPILARLIAAARSVVGCEFVSVERVADGRLLPLQIDPPESEPQVDPDVVAQLLSTHPLWVDFAKGQLTVPRKISDKLSIAQFENTPMYCEVYRTLNLRDQMVMAITPPKGQALILTLHSVGKCFGERDRKLLGVLGPFVREAHGHAEALERMNGLLGLIDQLIQVEDKPLAYFTRGLTNLTVSQSARRLLRKYFATWSELTAPLPDDVVLWIRQEEANASVVDNLAPPSGPLRIAAESSALTIRLHADREQRLLIIEEEVDPMPLRKLAVLGLTQREAEILFWVTEGKTNAEIGTLCVISPRTVQKHVEHIYQKIGVETRVAAVKTAIGAILEVPDGLKGSS